MVLTVCMFYLVWIKFYTPCMRQVWGIKHFSEELYINNLGETSEGLFVCISLDCNGLNQSVTLPVIFPGMSMGRKVRQLSLE